jgi:hypothetical protein
MLFSYLCLCLSSWPFTSDYSTKIRQECIPPILVSCPAFSIHFDLFTLTICQESGSRYSNSLRAGWPRVRTSVRAEDFSLRQNLSRPAWGPRSLLQWVLWFLPGAKRLGHGADYSPLVDKVVIGYLYSRFVSSWHVEEKTFPFC